MEKLADRLVHSNVMGNVWELVTYSGPDDESREDRLGRDICSLVCELVLNALDDGGSLSNRFSGREKQKLIEEWVEQLVQMDSDPRNKR